MTNRITDEIGVNQQDAKEEDTRLRRKMYDRKKMYDWMEDVRLNWRSAVEKRTLDGKKHTRSKKDTRQKCAVRINTIRSKCVAKYLLAIKIIINNLCWKPKVVLRVAVTDSDYFSIENIYVSNKITHKFHVNMQSISERMQYWYHKNDSFGHTLKCDIFLKVIIYCFMFCCPQVMRGIDFPFKSTKRWYWVALW